jgi:hypothetical protein
MGDIANASNSVILCPDLLPKSAPAPVQGRGQRLVREVCREGRWFVGGNPDQDSSYYTITADLCRQLADSWEEREVAGLRCPLQRDHSISGIHTDSINVVLYWDEMWVEDGFDHGASIFAGCYPGQKLDELVQEPCPVSPNCNRSKITRPRGRLEAGSGGGRGRRIRGSSSR